MLSESVAKLSAMNLLRTEPAAVCSVVAALVVAGAAKFGVVLAEQDVAHALLAALPVLLAGAATRHHVVPVHAVTSTLPQIDGVDKR